MEENDDTTNVTYNPNWERFAARSTNIDMNSKATKGSFGKRSINFRLGSDLSGASVGVLLGAVSDCPFCGDNKSLEVVDKSGQDLRSGANYRIYRVHCGNCSCDGPVSEIGFAHAVSLWNVSRVNVNAQIEDQNLLDVIQMAINAASEEFEEKRSRRSKLEKERKKEK